MGVQPKKEASGDLSHSVSMMMNTGLNRYEKCYQWLLLWRAAVDPFRHDLE